MADAGLSHAAEEVDCCWICLSGPNDNGETLERPCRCPRSVHLKCLARWQLQSAGKNEENTCRFCNAHLPDWRSTFSSKDLKPVSPVMAIRFEGKTYKMKVKPGPEGLKLFKEQVRLMLGFDISEDFDVTFECHVPQTGEKMKLSGLGSYAAATQCAAISAAHKQHARKQHQHGKELNTMRVGTSTIPLQTSQAPASGLLVLPSDCACQPSNCSEATSSMSCSAPQLPQDTAQSAPTRHSVFLSAHNPYLTCGSASTPSVHQESSRQRPSSSWYSNLSSLQKAVTRLFKSPRNS